MRWLLILAFCVVASAASYAQRAPAPARIYAVIFEATVNASGKIEKLTVAKVIDPASGNTDPVAINVPPEYVDAAKTLLQQRTYPADPPHFYTYTYYDPARPSTADIDPRGKTL